MKKETREHIWEKYDRKCAYCGEELQYNKMQVDHIQPKYLGGSDDISNYNPSCRQCNFYKSTFSIDGFRQQLQYLIERIKKPFIVRLAIKYGMISFKQWDGVFYFERFNKQSMEISKTKLHKILKKYRELHRQHKESWNDACARITEASKGSVYPNEVVYKQESYKYQLRGSNLFNEIMEELEGYEVFPKKNKL